MATIRQPDAPTESSRPGPKSWYGPKGQPISLALTDEAKAMLDALCASTPQASRADIVECLIRAYHQRSTGDRR